MDDENLSETDMELLRQQKATSVPNKYYVFLRQEIEREDEITNQRLTWLLTFQGFLINAMAFLLVFSWDVSEGMFVVRTMALFAVGIIGLLIGFYSLTGILASRNSIRHAKDSWEKRNKVWGLYPNFVPQTYGQKKTFESGTSFTKYIPLLFIWMWYLFVTGYMCSISIFEIPKCTTADDVIGCIYDNRMQKKNLADPPPMLRPARVWDTTSLQMRPASAW